MNGFSAVSMRSLRSTALALVAPWMVACIGFGTLGAFSDAAHAQIITEFTTGITPGTQPLYITAGPDGNVWFTEGIYPFTRAAIARITPLGVVTEFTEGLPTISQPRGITAGPDGNLWFADQNGTIGRITPAGVITEFAAGITFAPIHITAGHDGNLWFTEYFADIIGRITPAGVVTQFQTGITPGALIQNITAGPDGNVWFTEYATNKIGRITPAGVVTEFSDGISRFGSNNIAELNAITAGPDGNVWFTEDNISAIGRITPEGVVTEFTAGINPGGMHMEGIVTGSDGNLWFTQIFGPWIGRITPLGVVTEFSKGLSLIAEPYGITAGPDGNLWFTESAPAWIGRITTTGVAAAPAFQHAASRKTHGAAGTFDLPLTSVATNPTTEPRAGPNQSIVFTFDKPVSSAVAMVSEGTASAGSISFSGNDVILALTGVGNQQYVTVSLTGVASADGGTGGSASMRVGYLLGDVNQNRVVTVADLGLVNAQLAQPVTQANFMKDVNASGTLSVADKALVSANLTRGLPAP